MRSKRLLLALVALLALPATAQENDSIGTQVPYATNACTMLGVGGYNIQDTYLSPGSHTNYKGVGFRVLNERMKMTHLMDSRVSRQQIISADISFTDNGGGTATDCAGFFDYSLAYHYHFEPASGLRLLAGASIHGMGGFIYNTRNGNNPATGKLDVDLNLSALAIWKTHVGKLPLTVRLQVDAPFAGVLFSPHYGQSYYEIFDLGNKSGIVRFSSFHNKIALKHLLTVDVPVSRIMVRAGYLGSWYQSDINDIHDHIISHSFMIGFVKEFVAFEGKKMYRPKGYRSAYY